MPERAFSLVVGEKSVVVGIDQDQIVSIWVDVGNNGAGEFAMGVDSIRNRFK